jgi:hypothetical protein
MAYVVTPANLNETFFCLSPREGFFPSLMWRQLLLPAEPHAAGLGPGPAPSCPRQDWASLELRKSTEDRYHQLAVWGRVVGPCIRQGPEPRTSTARQPIQPRDQQHVPRTQGCESAT